MAGHSTTADRRQAAMLNAQGCNCHLPGSDIVRQRNSDAQPLLRHSCTRGLQQKKQCHRQQFRPVVAFSAAAKCCNRNRSSRLSCKALAAPITPPPQYFVDIPFGDTAGANLIMESVTVQAGHRDLLEVFDCCKQSQYTIDSCQLTKTLLPFLTWSLRTVCHSNL